MLNQEQIVDWRHLLTTLCFGARSYNWKAFGYDVFVRILVMFKLFMIIWRNPKNENFHQI